MTTRADLAHRSGAIALVGFKRREQSMRRFFGFIVPVVFAIANVVARSSPLAPDSFSTNAAFSVDRTSLSLSTVVATIEQRRGAPGYSSMRIYFYSFPPTSDDLAGIASGDVSSMDKRWTKLANNHDNSYNVSHAVIQLSVDKNFKVWQVDMSVPGHSCTIAPFEPDVKKVLQDYRFDGKTLRLKSKGSYICDMSFMKIPNSKYYWDINVETPVFAKNKR
jgi:hypothetical protein